MTSCTLLEAVIFARLEEQEAWAVVSQSLEAMQRQLSCMQQSLEQAEVWRSAVLTPHIIQLTPGGEVRLGCVGAEVDLTSHLPQRMKPLLDLTPEDLERLAVFSLAKTVLSSLECVRSPDLLLLLKLVRQLLSLRQLQLGQDQTRHPE